MTTQSAESAPELAFKAADNIDELLDNIGEPLTDTQRMTITGALAVWLAQPTSAPDVEPLLFSLRSIAKLDHSKPLSQARNIARAAIRRHEMQVATEDDDEPQPTSADAMREALRQVLKDARTAKAQEVPK